jgi:hypothetical protein
MSTQRLNWLDQELDREDLPEHLAELYMKEANAIQTEINNRKVNQQVRRDKEMQEANELALLEKNLAITDEEVEEMYVAFHKLNAGKTDANGRTFDEWFEKAIALYDIKLNGKYFEVTSKAKSDNEVIWEDFVSIAHARSKILELLKIKFRDHHNRPDREGCDFAHIVELNEEIN